MDSHFIKKGKKSKKKEYSQHNENTAMVTNLNAISFRSVSSIPFTAPARFFISSAIKVVEVRLVMGGWFMSTVCHQICTHLGDYRIPNKVS